MTVIEQAIGRCVDNAEQTDTPMYLCKGDGKWYLPTGGCKCKAGFEADLEKQTCNGKTIFTLNRARFHSLAFKWQTGDRFETESRGIEVS